MGEGVEVDEYVEESEVENWMPKVLILGAVIGAATGLLGAYLLIQHSKNEVHGAQAKHGGGSAAGGATVRLAEADPTAWSGRMRHSINRHERLFQPLVFLFLIIPLDNHIFSWYYT